ncbi:hypothetical protein ACS0TY_014630 [Phlomoides rotata]
MEKFDALSSSLPRETLPPLVQEQQGVQEVNYMGRPNFQGGNYHQGKPNFQGQQQGQFPQYSQGRYNATSNFQGGSSYNPNFKHHENFSYANQKAAVQFPPGFNPGAKLPNNEGRPSSDELLELMFEKMKEKDVKMDEFIKATNNQIKTLEHQMGQMTSNFGQQHQKGKFSSTTETNPKEHCKAIKLRSGTKYDGPSNPLDEEEMVQEEKEELKEDQIEEEELELAKEDEEDKSMGTEREKKKEQEEMNGKAKKDESAQQVPKWKRARNLKEKESDEVQCDE